MAQFSFNATEVEPSTGYTPIPAGKYLAVITEDEMKDSKSGGQYLKLTFELIEGEYKGRKLWVNLNLVNSNPKAVEIARADLSAICRAVNVMQLQDTVQLYNLPLVINVKCKKNAETGEMQNEVKGYEAKANYAPGAVAAAPAPQTGALPWARK
jgi:hypothetical protein